MIAYSSFRGVEAWINRRPFEEDENNEVAKDAAKEQNLGRTEKSKIWKAKLAAKHSIWWSQNPWNFKWYGPSKQCCTCVLTYKFCSQAL